MEEDGITIVDFKTDFVTEDTIMNRAEHYRPQVQAYADAMARIYNVAVKRRVLYFFCLDRLVEM